MPLYDFTCEPCGVTFEVSRSFKDSDVPAYCPRCEQQARKLLSTPMTVFTRGAAAEASRAMDASRTASSGARWSHHGHSHGPGAGGHSH